MRVTKIDLYRVALPLIHEFETSSHRKSMVEHVLVRMTDESGQYGWGEIASPSDPYYCAETADTVLLIGRSYLVPLVVDRIWDHPGELAQDRRRVRGNEFAKAGFDIAAWDLWSKAHGLSLSAALGGTRSHVMAGVSLGIEPTIDHLVEQVQHHIDAGYARVKLKIKPGWDVEPVRAVRQAFPDVLLHVDANGAYQSEPGSFERLRRLDAFDLAMIEQPFSPREFVAHAELRRSIATPICLDESVVDIGDLTTMITLESASVLNIKVSRMGGLTPSLAAYRLARDAGIAVWCGGMHEFGIGRAANVAFSSLPDFDYPSDVSGSDKYYTDDVIEPPVVATAGAVRVPQGVGIGHRVMLERIGRAWQAPDERKIRDLGDPSEGRTPTNVLIVVNSTTSGPGNLLAWLEWSGVTVTVVSEFQIPRTCDGFDGVILLGGGLLPDDDDEAPWLAFERLLVTDCIQRRVPLLGICLGAQVLSAVAGGTVEGRFGAPERGVVMVTSRPEAADDRLFRGLDPRFPVLQNHRDQITGLPPGAVHLVQGDDCVHQAFRVGDVAWGVQFHPEAPISRIDRWDPVSLRAEGFDLRTVGEQAAAAEPQMLETSGRLVQNFADIVAVAARHRRIHVIDGHNDLLWELRKRGIESARFSTGIDELQTDLPRLRAGGVGAQFWSVWVPDQTPQPLVVVLEQIERLRELIRSVPDDLHFTRSASEIRGAIDDGKIACLIGAEGAHCLECELSNVEVLAGAGVRYMTLTHNASTMWADSATGEPLHDGLSERGAALVAELERTGVLVDLSHVSEATMHGVLDIATAPVIFSHSSNFALTRHRRNVSDDVLRRLADNGGVQMITFVPQFVSESIAQLADVADHVEHTRAFAGIAHVGIGGDFDGIAVGPRGLEDVSRYPALLEELSRRGWSAGELAALASENVLRVIGSTDSAFAEFSEMSDSEVETSCPPTF